MSKASIAKDTIHFIMTGGTIDSTYDATRDTVVPFKHSFVPQFIRGLKLYKKSVFTEICMKDSRDITMEDRKKILHTVQHSPHRRIIITHGTYTTPDTARFLQANLKRKKQVIVLTASMIPLNGFAPSDAPFSIGFSIAQVSILPPGVYVCMNGRVFSAMEVAKEIKKGRFVSVFMGKN